MSHRDNQDEWQEPAEEFGLRLFGADVPADQDFVQTYRCGVRSAIKWLIVAGRYTGWVRDAQQYAASQGWTLPAVLPVGHLDIENSESGLCSLIRQGVKSGFLSGEEQWLRPANWKGGQDG